jgi:hypothetical protein
MKTVDVPVTRVVLGPAAATDVTARAPGAIAAGDVWMRTSDGARIPPPKAHDALPTARKAGLAGQAPAPIADLSSVARRIKGDVVRTIDADPAMVVDTVGRRSRRAYWVCGRAAWPLADKIRPDVRLEVIAPETALAFDPFGERAARVYFADGREGATLTLPGWLVSALGVWRFDAARYVWGLPDDAIVAMTLLTGVAWMPIPALLEAVTAERVRWIPHEVFPSGTDAETAGEVLFASDNMTLVASGTDRVLVKVRTGCAKGERVRLVGRSLGNGPPQYTFLVRANGARVACGSGAAPATPEETPVRRGN